MNSTFYELLIVISVGNSVWQLIFVNIQEENFTRKLGRFFVCSHQQGARFLDRGAKFQACWPTAVPLNFISQSQAFCGTEP